MEIDYRVSRGRLLNFTIAAVSPLVRVLDYPGANHVQVDIEQTALKVFVGFDGGGMITVFPKRAMPVLALVVLLRGSACD